MVPRRRLELPQDCSYTPLKRARLPIPPPGQARRELYQLFAQEIGVLLIFMIQMPGACAHDIYVLLYIAGKFA